MAYNALDMYFACGERDIRYPVDAAVIEHIAVNSFVTMIELAGRHNRPALPRSVQETRKRNVNTFPNVELIGIGNVIHYRSYGVVFVVAGAMFFFCESRSGDAKKGGCKE